ncbi:cation channel sperm-associated protein subunit gamma-like isoform X2 [Acanthaster planci]|nr:cation channel sperm-associated protein subunit gamma-like isoform X2 [Acanthaster planci]
MFNPFYCWHEKLLPLMPFNDYMFENGFLRNDTVTSPLEYTKTYESNDGIVATTLPAEIFLDRLESFNFKITITADGDYLSGGVLLNELWVTVEVSDENLLDVISERKETYINSSIKYEVLIAEKGSLRTRLASGVGLHSASVLIQVGSSPFECFSFDSFSRMQLQGTSSLSVQVGCPPSKHLVFDIPATLHQAEIRYGEIYDCPIPDPEYPCFYYKHGFNPVFRVLDVVTGKSSLFTDQYILRVIGGSTEGADNIEYFSSEKLQQYNMQNGSGPLIWTPEDTNNYSNGSVPIFQHGHSGIVWRCEQGTPCASVPMHFPWSPEYYFVMEVTNRQVSMYSTYCEYTAQVTIKVHGLELSKYDLMAIVGWSLVISWVFIASFVICHRQKSRGDKHRHHKRKLNIVAPMPIIREVEVSDESETEEVINIVEGRDFGVMSMESTLEKSS